MKARSHDYLNNWRQANTKLTALEAACENLLDKAFIDYYASVDNLDLDKIAELINYNKDWRRT